MTQRGKNVSMDAELVKGVLTAQEDFLRPLVQAVVQEVLEAERTEALGAEKSERTGGRMGYRSGYYSRKLVTRVARIFSNEASCLRLIRALAVEVHEDWQEEHTGI